MKEKYYRCPMCPGHQPEYMVSHGFTGGSYHYMSCGHLFGTSSGFWFKGDENGFMMENWPPKDETMYLELLKYQHQERPDWTTEALVIGVSRAKEKITWLKEEDLNYIYSRPWYDGQGMKYRIVNTEPRIDISGKIKNESADELMERILKEGFSDQKTDGD